MPAIGDDALGQAVHAAGDFALERSLKALVAARRDLLQKIGDG